MTYMTVAIPMQDAQTYFLHDLSPEVLALLMSSREERPADSLFQTRFPLTHWPEVPTTVLAGRDDRIFPYELQSRVARERLGLDVEQLPGGHLLALSQSEVLVARLLRGL
jgi:pimeloyl-ACP methyl ester carboxylesterase